MTPDELITRMFRQRADIDAAKLALEALMVALPKEQQQLWLQALSTLAATRAATLEANGVDATAVQAQKDADERQLQRLRLASRALVPRK